MVPGARLELAWGIPQRILRPLPTRLIDLFLLPWDQEDVAELFRREDLYTALVVDDDKLIGTIRIDDVVGFFFFSGLATVF